MAKYSDEQLKSMADDTLFAYHSGDQRADMLIQLLCQVAQRPPEHIVFMLNQMADKEI